MGWFSKSNPPPPPIEPPPPAPARAAPPQAAPATSAQSLLACSFCGKSQKEVKKLIAGPSVYICDECVTISADLVKPDPEEGAIAIPPPSALEEALDAVAVGQRAAKRTLVAALRRHLAGSAQPGSDQRAPRVLIIGPSGSGKTTLGKAICQATSLPSYHADVGRLSESGFVGEDVENLLGMLLTYAEGKADVAEHGVLVLDGLEKLRAATPLTRGRDISGEGVQRELIRLLDGLDLGVPVYFQRRHPQAEATHLTCRTLFVAGFVRIDLQPAPAPGGYRDAPQTQPRHSERELRAALAAAGLIPELLSRFDRVILLPRPDAAALLAMLNHEHGPIAEARRVVEALGGSLTWTQNALLALAEAAATSPEGAWLLGQVVDRQLEDILTAQASNRAWDVDERQVRAILADVV